MRSVRDSFDSDGEFLPDIGSRDTVAKSQRKKASLGGNAIPKGAASGFKKASELLRDTEAAKLGFGAGLNLKNGVKPAETSEVERKVKDSAKSEVRTRARAKKKGSLMLDAETAEPPVTHTSHYFANDGANESHARPGMAIQKQEIQATDKHDSLESQRKNKDERPVIDLTESYRSNLTSAIENDESESTSNNVSMIIKENKHGTTEEDDHFPMISSPPVAGSLVPASRMRTTVDLTAEYDASEINEDNASKIASITEKYSCKAQDPEAVDSRKSIELIQEDMVEQVEITDLSLDRPIPTKTASPIKRKSPVKKQLTLTERALDEFRPEEIRDSLHLQDYFSVTSPNKQTEEVKKTNRAKSRTKLAGKTRKVEKKSSLLAPMDAIQSLHGQQVMFGTSSQLLQHSSSPNHPQNNTSREHHVPTPNLSRDDSFIDIDLFLDNPSNMLGLKSTRSLWSAATRDSDGTLMHTEPPNLSSRSITAQEPSLIITTKTVSKPEPQSRDFDTEEAHKTAIPPSVDTPQLPPMAKSIPVLPRSLGEAATKQRHTSRPPVKKKRKIRDLMVKPEDAFKKVPVADLKAELKSFGCKPPRSKAKMVELLLECRANQSKPQEAETETMQSEQPNQDLEVSIATSTKPQDNADISLDTVADDITALEPSQSKRKRTQVENLATDSSSDNLPPPSFQVPPEEDEQTELDQAQLDALMSGIHRAIMAQPPSHSITNPSWKEKIAMYDPIVLEELTAWLNTGGLDAVGIDTEVWPTLVRDWCESKSVCFIWTTEGWRKKRA